jgi:hypothetical protein
VLVGRGPIVQVTVSVGQQVASQVLQLPAIDVVTVASASHSSTTQNVYPIQIEVVGLPIAINAPRAIGAPLQSQGILVLIGRDVLQHCVLVYNGPTGSFSLSI